MNSVDLEIIKETLETVKQALSAVVKADDIKKNRLGLWIKCKNALDVIETDLEPRLPKAKGEAPNE